MAGLGLGKFKEMLGKDDSLLVDSSSLTADGADLFFTSLVAVLPRLRKYTLIIPLEAVNGVNEGLESADPVVKERSRKAAVWLNQAVALSDPANPYVIFVGEAKGAFADKTVLNQVSFLMPNHNVLLITQDEERTKKARALRKPATQGDHKLHCCRIKPDGTLGLYYFPEDDK